MTKQLCYIPSLYSTAVSLPPLSHHEGAAPGRRLGVGKEGGWAVELLPDLLLRGGAGAV